MAELRQGAAEARHAEAKRGGELSDVVTTLKQRVRALEAGERKLRDGLAGAPVAARGYGEPERQALGSGMRARIVHASTSQRGAAEDPPALETQRARL